MDILIRRMEIRNFKGVKALNIDHHCGRLHVAAVWQGRRGG